MQQLTTDLGEMYDKLISFTRRGNVIERRVEYINTVDDVFCYMLPCKMPSVTARGQDPVNFEFVPDLPMKTVAVPYKFAGRAGFGYSFVYGEIPNTKYPIADAVLMAHPDAVVYYVYRYATADEDKMHGIVIQKDGFDFLCEDFPTIMKMNGGVPAEFIYCDKHGPHSTTGKAVWSPDSELFHVIRNIEADGPNARFHDMTVTNIIEALFLLHHKLEPKSCHHGYYYNKGRHIPTQLIEAGAIDPFNFDETVDGFTLDMCPELKIGKQRR